MAYKRNPRSEIRTKMKFIFFCSVAVVTSRTLKSAELGDLGSKLRKLDQYQAETGIDDDKRDEIWNTTMTNCTYKNKIIKNSRTAPIGTGTDTSNGLEISITKKFAIIFKYFERIRKTPSKK